MGAYGIGYRIGKGIVKVIFAGRNNDKFLRLIHENSPPDTTPFNLDVPTAIQELKSDSHLSTHYLESLANNVRHKGDAAAIMQYLKSTRAINLSPDEKAHIMQLCVEKLHWLTLITHFL